MINIFKNRSQLSTAIFICGVSVLAKGQISQRPVTLPNLSGSPAATALSANLVRVDAFRKLILSSPPTSSFTCRSRQLNLQVTNHVYLVKTCSDSMSQTLLHLSMPISGVDKTWDTCSVSGDQLQAKAVSSITITDSLNNILYNQPFAPALLADITSPEPLFQYGDGPDSYPYSQLHGAYVDWSATPQERRMNLRYSVQDVQGHSADIRYGKGFAMDQGKTFPSLSHLDLELDADTSEFEKIQNRLTCSSSDPARIAARISVDFATGTGTLVRNKMVLNPKIQVIQDGSVLLPTVRGYGWSSFPDYYGGGAFKKALVIKKCYDTSAEILADLNVTLPAETMQCSDD